MEEKIYSLENAPKIGINKSVFIGFMELAKNFNAFIKHCYPVFFILLGHIVLLPLIMPLTNIPLIIFLGILSVVLVCYGLWHYFLNIVAVSYLAKDIYENKPVQKLNDYIGYVRAHTKSYVKLLLWNALMQGILTLIFIGFILYFATSKADLTFTNIAVLFSAILFIILTIPLMISFSLMPITWSYKDKTYALDSAVTTIKAVYKNPFKIIWATFLIVFIMAIIGFLIQLTVTSVATIPLFLSSKTVLIPTMTKVIGSVVSFLFQLISFLVFCFIYTRYHFEFIKGIDKN